jgi:hypothetical protein
MEELHTDRIDGGHEASYGARSRARERAYSNIDPKRSRIEIVKTFQANISDNAMQRKGGPEESSSDSERSTWKGLEKGSHKLDGISDKSKRRKLLKL